MAKDAYIFVIHKIDAIGFLLTSVCVLRNFCKLECNLFFVGDSISSCFKSLILRICIFELRRGERILGQNKLNVNSLFPGFKGFFLGGHFLFLDPFQKKKFVATFLNALFYISWDTHII
jgi:hypothetical protein